MPKDKKGKSRGEGKGRAAGARSDDAPAWLIQRTARALRVLFLRLMQDQGEDDLTPEMWTVLTRLVVRDGQYQSELAAATYRDRPNMSRILAGMESRGLVSRRPDADDRRKTRIHLTLRARKVLAATAPVAARTRDGLYAGLSKKELKALRRALRIVEGNALALIHDLDGEAPPG